MDLLVRGHDTHCSCWNTRGVSRECMQRRRPAAYSSTRACYFFGRSLVFFLAPSMTPLHCLYARLTTCGSPTRYSPGLPARKELLHRSLAQLVAASRCPSAHLSRRWRAWQGVHEGHATAFVVVMLLLLLRALLLPALNCVRSVCSWSSAWIAHRRSTTNVTRRDCCCCCCCCKWSLLVLRRTAVPGCWHGLHHGDCAVANEVARRVISRNGTASWPPCLFPTCVHMGLYSVPHKRL